MRFTDYIKPFVLKKEDDAAAWAAPGQLQRQAEREFDGLAESYGLTLWKSTTQVGEHDSDGLCVVVGIVTWSLPDMRLMDNLCDSVTRLQAEDINLQVFNAANFTSHQDFEMRIPGLGFVFHTPAIGIWKGELLIDKASGLAARELVQRYLGISW